MKYGLDIKTPTTIPGKDGWEPVMVNKLARVKFQTAQDLFDYEKLLKASNSQIETRIVEIHDGDPTYSL
jgi:hypothetical protein